MENYFDRKNPIFPKGPIQLQTHGGEIQVEEHLHPRDRPRGRQCRAFHSGIPRVSFRSLFNGENLDGWKGAVDNYEVKDGAIVCKQGKGGNLLSGEEYGDVALRFEFKLPPGGNNGIAMRVPLNGHPAKDGIEVQVIDNTPPEIRQAERVAVSRLGLRPCSGEARFSPPRRRVEFSGDHLQGRPYSGGAQRVKNPRCRPVGDQSRCQSWDPQEQRPPRPRRGTTIRSHSGISA